MHSRRTYRHGDLPAALSAAVREILDESGLQDVGLRETARRVGVSTMAAYRHFTNKEDLLASVAAQGFDELAAAIQGAIRGADPLTRAGLAYIEFASQNQSLFRLMFGPLLAERTKYPAYRQGARRLRRCWRGSSPKSTRNQFMTIPRRWRRGALCMGSRI